MSEPIDMRIELVLRNIYGIDRIYPHNDAAKQFLIIAGGKTFKPEHLPAMKALGFEIKWIAFSLYDDTQEKINT